MKKIIIIFACIFTVLIVAAIATPYLFKDKILARLDQELAASVNADIFYDTDRFSLSFFQRFPNISATIGGLGIVGKGVFESDTLAQIDELQIDLNLKSVLFDDFPTLTGLHLRGGNLLIKVLEDGTANYDISIPSAVEESPSAENNFKIGIDLIEVEGLNVVYDDRSLAYFMALGNIHAEATGEFTSDVYELPISMEALIATLSYEGVEYLSNKKFNGKSALNIDMSQMKFSFEEGQFSVNDFGFGVEGFIAMPQDDITMDLSFAGKDNSFKSILSLVPGIYTESFSSLKTSGKMDFQGFLKGVYNENSFPAFELGLNISEGMFQYPDLPKPVQHVNLDLLVKNQSNDFNLTSVDIPSFALQIGSNPISGRLFLKDLTSYSLDAALKGQLNLEELTSIFPIEGLSLRGNLAMEATAKGKYDSETNIIPAINANLTLTNGYVKSVEYPSPIEKIEVLAKIDNPSGDMNGFRLDLNRFGFDLEGESILGKLKVSDFQKLIWDGEISGAIDLEKILAIFPMEGMEMKGKINADLQTKGAYADIESKQFDRLNTSGKMQVQGFYFNSPDVPQPIQIRNAKADFSQQRLNLTEFDSQLGTSPLKASGYLSNYLDYLLTDTGELLGELTLSSSQFNVNEWMTDTESAETPSSELSVIPLPNNVNFTMALAADKVLYDDMNLDAVKGKMILKNGVLAFQETSMNMLGGRISLDGNYDPRDLISPKFDFNLNISELSIPESFKTFNTIQAFAPIAEKLSGTFNSALSFSGTLDQNMMPVLSSLDGEGLLKIAETALKDSKILAGITSLTKLKETNTIQLKNISVPIEIHNGTMDVKPFDVKLWDYQANIQGTAGFDGSINYLINMQVPANKFGSQANALLTNLLGTSTENTMIPVALNLSGTYNSPKLSLAGANSLESLLSSALKAQTGQSTEELQQQVTEQFKASGDSMKQELKLKAEVVQDSVKKELEKQVNETKDKAVDEAKKLLKGFLKPKETVKPDTMKVGN